MISSRFSPFTRFLIAGGLNTAVTWAMYVLMTDFLEPTVAYSLTYAFGIILAYLVNSRFVFGSGLALRTAWRYPLVYVVQYAYGLAAVYILSERIGLGREIVILFVIISSLPITFVLSRALLSASGTPRLPSALR